MVARVYSHMPDSTPEPDDPPIGEETANKIYADHRNFFKVEKWTKDGSKIDSMIFAGNDLGRARAVFEGEIKRRPRIRLTIRRRTQIIDQWPRK
jgi:hypothetical protein